MKNILICIFLTLIMGFGFRKEHKSQGYVVFDNDSSRLVELLTKLAKNEKNPLLKRHFESVALMTADKTHNYSFRDEEKKAATSVLNFFNGDGSKWETYLSQPRPLIMAFNSKIDGKNSYYWLFLPKNFDPKKETDPFYLELHGSFGGQSNNPYFLLYQALQEKPGGVSSQGYRRDGFVIYPWGRGDKGYRDTAEADIWECLSDFDHMFKTDPKRQYLYGFSMGGAGTYNLSQKSLSRWTAIGMYSGSARNPTAEIAGKFKTIPVWLAWGDQEERTSLSNRAWKDSLINAGVEVSWREIKGVGHQYMGEYQDSLHNWFLLHTKK